MVKKEFANGLRYVENIGNFKQEKTTVSMSHFIKTITNNTKYSFNIKKKFEKLVR
jgi:hypothetical protein